MKVGASHVFLTKGAVLQKDRREIPKLWPNIRNKHFSKLFRTVLGALKAFISTWGCFQISDVWCFPASRYIHGEGPFCIRKLLGSSSKKRSLGSDLRTCRQRIVEMRIRFNNNNICLSFYQSSMVCVRSSATSSSTSTQTMVWVRWGKKRDERTAQRTRRF